MWCINDFVGFVVVGFQFVVGFDVVVGGEVVEVEYVDDVQVSVQFGIVCYFECFCCLQID